MTPLRRIGSALILVGLLILAAIGGMTLYDLQRPPDGACREMRGGDTAPLCLVSPSRLRLLVAPGTVLRLNGRIAVGIAGVIPAEADEAPTAKAAALPALAQSPTHRLALFIDSTRTPVTFDVDERAGVQTRVLTLGVPDTASDADAATWRRLLGNVPLSGRKTVMLGIGDAAATLPIAGAELPATLVIDRPPLVIAGALALLAIAGGLCATTWTSGMLRDPPTGSPLAAQARPFSLARVQMLWWLFLVIGGFIFVWLVGGAFDGVVNASALTLLGIQGATGLAAMLIGPGSGGSDTTALTSQGFWRDISSNRDGPQIQRIQLIAWTLILGAIFLWSVLVRVRFPDFDPDLLLLAGIANGLYLGFKWPEAAK